MVEGLLIVAGAAIAAVFGYGSWLIQRTKELSERRAALFELLATELQLFGAPLPAYDPTSSFYRDPIQLVSLDHLLEPGTVSPGKDRELYQRLVILKASLSKYNDFVRTINLAHATTEIPVVVHGQMHSAMANHYEQLCAARDEVRRLLRDTGHQGQLVLTSTASEQPDS